MAESRVARYKVTPRRSRALHRGAFGGRHYKRAGASIQGTLSNWLTSIVNARVAEREKRSVADRAWDLYINDAMAHGVVEGIVTQCVNIGLTPQPNPMVEWLGYDAEFGQEYQSKTYDLFEVWGLDPRNFCDTQRRLNFYMLETLAYFQWKLQGVSLFQTVFKENPFCPLSISFLPIDPSRVVTPYDASLKADIYDGFELDKNGGIKAVYVIKPGKETKTYAPSKDDCFRFKINNTATGLPNILVCCDVRNISEYKQDSILTCMIKEIRDSNDFVDASLVKSLVANLWTAFVTSEAEAARQHTAQAGQSDPATMSDWEDRIQELDKGTIITGFPGEKAEIFQSNAPGDNYAAMNDSIIGRLGMATGRGPENISRTYTSSYSASRAAIEDAAKFDDYDRMILVNCFCAPALAWVQYEGGLRGLIPIRSIEHFKKNLYAYTRANWLPPPSRPIDHYKEAQADGERLRSHTTTYADIYGERSSDWKPKLVQRALELKFIKELESVHGVEMSVGESATEPNREQTNDGDD